MGTVADRHPMVATALGLVRRWGRGRRIGHAPALAHARQVAATLIRHVPNASPELVAAALCHDAHDLAPAGTDVHRLLTTRLNAEAARVIRAVTDEHDHLDAGRLPDLLADHPTLLLAAADQIVSLDAMLSLSDLSPAFKAAVPYFRAFSDAAAPHLPAAMASELAGLVARAEVELGEP